MLAGSRWACIQGATSQDGPWHPISLLYQVNDPTSQLPFCFLLFPRFDWSLWFIPMEERGLWIVRFLQGLTVEDPAVLGLNFADGLLKSLQQLLEWFQRFVNGRAENGAFLMSFQQCCPSRERKDMSQSIKESWPSTPLLRPLAAAVRPECFVRGCLGASEATRRVFRATMVTDWFEEEASDT